FGGVWAVILEAQQAVSIRMPVMMLANRMQQLSHLSALECTFEIDWLQTGRPVFNCGPVRLRCFLFGAQRWLTRVGWIKFKPTDPRAVRSLLTITTHDVGRIIRTTHRGQIFLQEFRHCFTPKVRNRLNQFSILPRVNRQRFVLPQPAAKFSTVIFGML